MDCLSRGGRAALFADVSLMIVNGTLPSFSAALQQVIQSRHGWNGVAGNTRSYGSYDRGERARILLPGADRCFVEGDTSSDDSAYTCLFRRGSGDSRG